MLFSPNKNCHITPPPPHNGHLSTTATFFGPQMAVVGRFDCIKSYLQNDMLGKVIKKNHYKYYNILQNYQWFYSEIKIQRSNLYDTGIQILYACMYGW